MRRCFGRVLGSLSLVFSIRRFSPIISRRLSTRSGGAWKKARVWKYLVPVWGSMVRFILTLQGIG